MTNGADHMGPETERPPRTGDLLGAAFGHVSALLRSEIDLARAELDRSVSRAGRGVGFVVAGVAIAICALATLTGALVAALTVLLAETAYPVVFAALVVGAVYAIAAALFIRAGLSRLKAINLAPRRTVSNIKKDADLLKGTLQ